MTILAVRPNRRPFVGPIAVGLLCLALGLALAGCGGDEGEGPEGDALPPPQAVDPLGRSGPGEAPARAPEAGPVATWTMTRPGEAGEPPAPATAAPSASDVAARPTFPARAIGPTAAPPPMLTAGAPPVPDPAILALMASVRPERLARDVADLAAFGTRHALSVDDPAIDEDRGARAAGRWLESRFAEAASGGGSQVLVETEGFPLRLGGRQTDQESVIATLTGIGRRKRFVYVTAHQDSRTQDPLDFITDAPGADDDASGVAALLELARLMSGRQWDASIRLVAFAAGEQEQAGSGHHAPLARQVGLPIEAVFHNEAIGGGTGADAEGAGGGLLAYAAADERSGSRALARWARAVSARYGGLAVAIQDAPDPQGRRGDHRAFDEEGFAALRWSAAETAWERHHGAEDVPEAVDPEALAAVVRTNLALVASLALAPDPPTVAPRILPGTTGGTRIEWDAPADPSVAGAWVAVRGPDELAWRELRWTAGAGAGALELPGLPADEPLVAALALDDGRGHMSLFGPEARR